MVKCGVKVVVRTTIYIWAKFIHPTIWHHAFETYNGRRSVWIFNLILNWWITMTKDVETQHKFHNSVWHMKGCHENSKITFTKTQVSLGFSSLRDVGVTTSRQKQHMILLTWSIFVPCTNWQCGRISMQHLIGNSGYPSNLMSITPWLGFFFNPRYAA